MTPEEFKDSLSTTALLKFKVFEQVEKMLRDAEIEHWIFAKPSDDMGSERWISQGWRPGPMDYEGGKEFAQKHLDGLGASALMIYMMLAQQDGQEGVYERAMAMMIESYVRETEYQTIVN